MRKKRLSHSHRRRLSRREASEYLLNEHGIRRKPKTLAKDVIYGTGPRYRKDGRAVVYDVVDLDAFAESRLSGPVRSTSELGAA
jgi:hypothetical protein